MKNSNLWSLQKGPKKPHNQPIYYINHDFIQCLQCVSLAVFVQQRMVLSVTHVLGLSIFVIRLQN